MTQTDGIDPTLRILVDTANDGGFTSPPYLTLMVEGITITGQLTSEAEWLEENGWFEKLVTKAQADQNERQAIFDAIQEIEKRDGKLDNRWYRALAPELQTEFVNLRKARFFAGAALVPSADGNSGEGVLWRGKLSAVSGWSQGQASDLPPSGVEQP